MAYRCKKYLSLLLTVALVNSSIQPLYASFPDGNDGVVREAKAQVRMMMVEEALQTKLKTTASFVESWMPSFIKKAVSKLGTWVESTLKDLPSSYFAKSPLEIDYGRDRAYWLAHFSSAVDEIKDKSLSQDALQVRLIELQDMVFDGVLSPYAYENGLKALEETAPRDQALFQKVRGEFKSALKTAPGFIDQTFRYEASLYIQDLLTGHGDAQEFTSFIRYYRGIDNALDYKDTLTSVRSYLRENKKTLKIMQKDYDAIIATLNSEIGRIAKEEKKRLQANQAFSLAASSVLPYSGQEWDELAQPTNNSLAEPSKEKSVIAGYLDTSAKALRKLIHTGAKYAQDHPTQALMMALAGQVAAAAALNALKANSFKAPEQEPSPADNLSDEQDDSSQMPSFQEKGIPEHPTPLLPRSIRRTIDNDFQISVNSSTSSISGPSAAFFPNGDVMIAWMGGTTDGWGRVWSHTQVPLTDEFPFGAASGQFYYPFLTSLPNGNVFAAWVGYFANIYGRPFNGTGYPLTNNLKIPVSGSGTHPSVTALSNGDVCAAWFNTGSYYSVYGGVFNSSWDLLTPNNILLSPTGLDSEYPSLAVFSNGNVFAAWQGTRGSNIGIYGRLFNGLWTPLTNESLMSVNGTWYRYSPAAASLSNENLLVTWHGSESGPYNTYGRVFNSTTLVPLTTEIQLNGGVSGDRTHSSVAALPNGKVFVVWEGYQGGTYDIYGRLFDNTLYPLTNEFLLNSVTSGDQRLPFAISSPNADLFVTWYGDQGSAPNIYGRYLNNETIAALNAAATTTSASTTLNLATTTSAPTSVSSTSTVATTVSGTTRGSTSMGSTSTGATTMSEMTNSLSTLSLSSTTSSPANSASNRNFSENKVEVAGIVGGVVGGVVLVTVGGVVVKKYCFSKKHPRDSAPNLEMGSLPSSTHASISPFAPTSSGFTDHPSFVGAIQNHTYAIWKELSEAEAKTLQPRTAKKILPFYTPTQKNAFTLGKGNYGDTYAGRDLQTKELYAIKEVSGRKAVDESLREGQLQDKLKANPQVMSLIDYKHYEPSEPGEQPRLLQVMPLAYTNGVGYKEMLSFLKRKDVSLHEEILVDNFQQLMRGIAYMHTQGIYHLDIKDENILYMLDGSLRIADFGRARELGKNDQINDNHLGDRRKFSPETLAFIRSVWQQEGTQIESREIAPSFSAKAADTWSGGLYILELWLNDDPLSKTPYQTKVLSWTNTSFEKALAEIKPLQEGSPESFQGVLRYVLTADFKKRMMPDQAIKKLSSFKLLSSEERTKAFERLIVLSESQQSEAQSSATPNLKRVETINMYISDKSENYNSNYQ